MGATKGVAVLGSTGSIGRSTLAVLARQREHFRVVALTGGRNADVFEAQVAEWRPAFAGLAGTTNGAGQPSGPSHVAAAAPGRQGFGRGHRRERHC